MLEPLRPHFLIPCQHNKGGHSFRPRADFVNRTLFGSYPGLAARSGVLANSPLPWQKKKDIAEQPIITNRAHPIVPVLRRRVQP
jgi:hypothetical protein